MTSTNRSNRFQLNSAEYEHLTHRLCIACCDSQESNKSSAKAIWTSGKFETSETLCFLVLNDLVHPTEHVRIAAAESLADILKTKHMKILPVIIERLLASYDSHNILPEPKKDQFGRVSAAETVVDDWESRVGLAYGLRHLAPILPDKNTVISVIIHFIYLYFI